MADSRSRIETVQVVPGTFLSEQRNLQTHWDGIKRTWDLKRPTMGQFEHQ